MSKRTKYDSEFREGAVRIVTESGKPIARVARDLGINEGTLGNWVGKAREAAGGADAPLSESERAELTRLRSENAELRMQRDVLKRSEYNIPIRVSCRALGMSESWYYKHQARSGKTTAAQQRREDLTDAIWKYFKASEFVYGSPRVALDL